MHRRFREASASTATATSLLVRPRPRPAFRSAAEVAAPSTARQRRERPPGRTPATGFEDGACLRHLEGCAAVARRDLVDVCGAHVGQACAFDLDPVLGVALA